MLMTLAALREYLDQQRLHSAGEEREAYESLDALLATLFDDINVEILAAHTMGNSARERTLLASYFLLQALAPDTHIEHVYSVR